MGDLFPFNRIDIFNRIKAIEQYVCGTNEHGGHQVYKCAVEYNGSGRATAVGLASGPDGLYFTDLYKDIVPDSQEPPLIDTSKPLHLS